MIQQVSSSQERGRWGQPVKPGAQERLKWEEGGNVPLAGMTLEETASNMEGNFEYCKLILSWFPYGLENLKKNGKTFSSQGKVRDF